MWRCQQVTAGKLVGNLKPPHAIIEKFSFAPFFSFSLIERSYINLNVPLSKYCISRDYGSFIILQSSLFRLDIK